MLKLPKSYPTNFSRFVSKLRGLNFVMRWNYHPRIRQENVAEHSYWVAMLSFLIAYRMGKSLDFCAAAASVALFHDADECITGDIPALVKREMKEYPTDKALEELAPKSDAFTYMLRAHMQMAHQPEFKVIIKTADLIAAYLYADEELRMGNQEFIQIRGEIITSLIRMDDGSMLRVLLDLGIDLAEARMPITEISHL